MTKRILWSRDQRLAAFRLYCHTPFGKLHRNNPEIIELAHAIGRTPSSVAMKTVNFASLDPIQQARNIAGLGNASNGDTLLWEEFTANPEFIAAEAEAAYANLVGQETEPVETELFVPDGPTEVSRIVRTRRVQTFFRAAVLSSYDYRCALSDMAIPELLNASHIIPWKENIERRADPRNGLALNALFDRAFDRGLITFDESYRVVLSPRLRLANPSLLHRQTFLDVEGRNLRMPYRFAPDPMAMSYHREHVFMQ